HAANEGGAGQSGVLALLGGGDLGSDGGEPLIGEAGIVGADKQVVVDLEIGDSRLGGGDRVAQLGDLVGQPAGRLGGIGQRQLRAAGHVGGGDGVGDIGGALRAG